jgi:hypothetical protein
MKSQFKKGNVKCILLMNSRISIMKMGTNDLITREFKPGKSNSQTNTDGSGSALTKHLVCKVVWQTSEVKFPM